MKKPDYYENFTRAVKQSQRVSKIRDVAPAGAKSYIKAREKSLRELHRELKSVKS